jgi:hypothetical protein
MHISPGGQGAWLAKCGQLSRLGFNANHRIKDSIKHVVTYRPVEVFNLDIFFFVLSFII